MSFSRFLEYLQVEKNYSPNTLTAYKADLESFSEFIFYEFDEKEKGTYSSYDIGQTFSVGYSLSLD